MRSLALAALLALTLPLFAHDVEGWVYAPDGTPVKGAAVTAYLAEGSAEESARKAKGTARPALASAKSDEGGHFRLIGLPDAMVEVEAEAEELGTAVRFALVDNIPQTITLSEVSTALYRDGTPIGVPPVPPATGDGSISGTVRLDGKPLAGVPLVVHGVSSAYVTPFRVVSDAKGRYQVSGLPPLPFVVSVSDAVAPLLRLPEIRLYEEGREPYSAHLEKERKAVVDLDLVRVPRITGRVVDAEGKGVGGAHVQVVLAGLSALDFLHGPTVERTFADGHYAIGAPQFDPGESSVVAVTPRLHATVRSKAFVLGDGNHRIDITLPPFHAVMLRVLDGEKKPVPKALVAFADSEEIEDVRRLLPPAYPFRAARTNEAGELLLHLTPGTYDFAAVAAGFQQGRLAGRAVSRATTIDFPLAEAYTLRGRVHRNGKGVAGVRVGLRVVGDAPRDDDPATTAADGTFRIEGLARGKARLSVFKNEELIHRTLQVDVPSEVDVALPPAGTLRGRVIDAATREPVRGFVYSVEPLETADGGSFPAVQHGGDTADGTFTMTLSAGRYRVTASATGFTTPVPMEVQVRADEPAEVELALDRGVTITGRVTDENGSPVRAAEVFAAGAEPDPVRARTAMRAGPGISRTGEDGTFTVTGIEPGTFTLTVRQVGYVLYRKVLEADGAPMSVNVVLSRGLSLRGVVTRGGKPVAPAHVAATTPAIGGDPQSATTDESGRFVLEGLIAARYTIAAFTDEVNAEIRNVDPSVQKELAISLDPKPRGVIFGTITGLPPDLRGKIVQRSVYATNEEDVADAFIDDAGNYRMENAPTGRVWIAAQVTSSSMTLSSERREVEVEAGQPLRVDLDISGRYPVRGRVTYDGRPLARARVVFTSENSMTTSTMTVPDGSYELALPSAGTYQIVVQGESVGPMNHQSIRTIRGGDTIDLDVREQTIEGTVMDAATRQPLAGAIVTLLPEPAFVQSTYGEVITDANGRFRLLTGASGTYRLMAAAAGYAQGYERLTLGGSRVAPLTLALPAGSELRVRVVDGRTGGALQAYLQLALPNGTPLPIRWQRNADGETQVASLAAGEYQLTVAVQGYPNVKVAVKAPARVDVKLDVK